jgi:DNA-binding GntR family transcriptional regulator
MRTIHSGQFDAVRAPLLRDQVRRALYEALRTGQLQPGDRIVELRLAREMEVSQSVVREALRELEQMGLVESFPNRGTYVRRITREDASEIYSMRANLESFAVHLALPRLAPQDFTILEEHIERMLAAARAGDEQRFVDEDVSFHRLIITAANHRLLLRTWEGINPFNWTFVTYIRLANDDPVSLARRHVPVLDALRSGDTPRARAAIEEHIMQLGEGIVPLIDAPPTDRADGRGAARG